MAAVPAERKARMLVVDDEPEIASMLEEFFGMEGYDVRTAHDGASALAAVVAGAKGTSASAGGPEGAAGGFDVILLDVNMPGMDGFEVCRRVREYVGCPIIFLTARVEDVDQIDGFAAGADDYVLKPFSLAVLGRRVAAHLARERRQGASRPSAEAVRFFDNITIDYAQRKVSVSSGGGRVVADLTRTEFDIVALLSKRPGQVFDRDTIYQDVWGWDATGDAGIIREHVRRIRRKLADAGASGDCIETVWGAGYKWAAR